MKLFLICILFLIGTTVHAQITCIRVDCKTIIQLPIDTFSLNGNVTTKDQVTKTVWSLVTGSPNVKIVNNNSLSTSITNLTAGTYIFSLSATTNKNAIGMAFDTIIAIPANNPPIAIILPATSIITLPVNSITLDGSKSLDSDGKIVGYKWSTGDTTPLIQLIFGAAGVYNYSLTVTDNQGATNTGNTTITVNPAIILPPIVTINYPASVSSTTDTLIVTAIDQNQGGTIKQYGWGKLSGAGTQVINGATTSKAIITGLQSGQYSFKVTVWNAAGLTGSAIATFIVNQPTKTITKIVITYSDGTSQTLP